MTLLFKDLLNQNEIEIMSYMAWENYELNTTVIPVIDLIKEHSLMVLSKSYGSFHVEQTILDELCSDIFIYFPILLQQLGISRLMDAYGVVPDDIDTNELTRTEVLSGKVDQNSELTVGTTNTDSTILDTEQKTTGTITTDNEISSTQNSTTNIENVSGIEMTGSRNVNLTHSMPEQSIVPETGNFPVDAEGTPVLTTSFVQSASEGFSTTNPIDTMESSDQTALSTTSGNNDSTTTNDITISDSGTNTRTSVNSGKDNTESQILTDNTNTITETRTSKMTNKQYAYEIKAFLESTDTLVAFSRWEDKFSWIIGII